jgi:hypothetical protein
MKRSMSELGQAVSPVRAAHLHGRDAHATGKIFYSLAAVMILLIVAGCHEPDYRTDVTGNGEGGVEIHRVPKDPSETVAQPAPAVQAETKTPLEQRIEVLEATVLRQQEEIATLRRQVNASTTTSPAPR